MKRIVSKYVSYVSLLLVFVFAFACGGRGTSGSSDLADNGEVKFMLDGVQWTSGPPGHPEMKFEEEAITDDNTMVRIEAFAEDGSHMAITVYNGAGIGVGTFPITAQGMRGYYKTDFAKGGGFVTNGMDDNPGTVTITKLTRDEVVGTFQFAMRNAGDPEDIRQVTNGSFDLSISRY